MRWKCNFHRIERIRRVYQPGHTAYSISLNARRATGLSRQYKVGHLSFTIRRRPRCRSPPVRIYRNTNKSILTGKDRNDEY